DTPAGAENFFAFGGSDSALPLLETPESLAPTADEQLADKGLNAALTMEPFSEPSSPSTWDLPESSPQEASFWQSSSGSGMPESVAPSEWEGDFTPSETSAETAELGEMNSFDLG